MVISAGGKKKPPPPLISQGVQAVAIAANVWGNVDR